ncbi:MAG: aconitate hydratase [Phycisphaerae bacterium]|nr:aconitate hydratase [Phycisphaerae bacterium]
MQGTVIAKILAEHLAEGKLEVGTEIAIRIDQALTQDVTGTMVCLELEAMGVERVSVPLAVSYVDHNTAQFGPNNQNDHHYLQSMAAKLGVKFSRPGNGICHQVHLERFAGPGKTLLGSDSHTPTAGGIGALGIGAGGLDVALAMEGEPFRLICPRIIGVELVGELGEWVTAKDVILKVLSILSTLGNTGSAVEYFGAGVTKLSVPQRATITNMGAELGVTSSVFPADDKTREFLTAQEREKDYVELSADKDAEYERLIQINLSELEPLIACPSSPGNVKTVTDVAGTKIQQVWLGSCTNSSYQDLMTAARMLKGKTVHANVSMAVSPGSRAVYEMIAANGALGDLIGAGCRILESACGPCIGVGFSPGSGVVSLRSNNRNFAGRSGTAGDMVYLASPEVLCASALKGCISDPRELEMDYPRIDWPKKFLVDDRMIIEPPAAGSEVEILRAETIGQPPSLDALPDELRGKVLLKLGDKITTDGICPAGQHLKWRSNIAEYAKVAFEAFTEQGQGSFAERALKLKETGKCGFIVAGKSYGQGSSREHAAICPRYLGVRMVIAESFERIHSDNLVNWGIIPARLADGGDGGKFAANDELVIKDLRSAVKDAEQMMLRNVSQGCDIKLKLELTERQRKILLAGGRLNYSK